MMRQPKRLFSTSTAYLLTSQLIERLRGLHSLGYIHNDIKLDNLMVGRGPFKEEIFLIDFGVSTRFLDSQGNHISPEGVDGATYQHRGNAQLASDQVLAGNWPSRRDDLLSAFYLLILMLKKTLPWSRCARLSKPPGYFKQMFERMIP